MSSNKEFNLGEQFFIFGNEDGAGMSDKIMGQQGSVNLYSNAAEISELVEEFLDESSELRYTQTQTGMNTRLLKVYAICRDLVSALATDEHLSREHLEMPFVYVDKKGMVRFTSEPRPGDTEGRDLQVRDEDVVQN